MSSLRWRVFRLLAATLITACGRPERPLPDSAVDRLAESPTIPGVVPETIPPHPYMWRPGAVDTFMATNAPPASRRSPPPSLGVPRLADRLGAEYVTGGTRVRVYIFGDQIAAGRAAIDALGIAGDSLRVFATSNLVVIIAPGEAPLADRLERLLTAHGADSTGNRPASKPGGD
jgi:hypothetical protein